MNLELYEVMGNAGGDEGRITTAGLQVAPCGAGCGSPLRGQRQPPEAAGGLASQHREGSSGGRDQAHLRSLAVPLGGPDVERQRPLHQGGVQCSGLCTGMAGKGDAMWLPCAWCGCSRHRDELGDRMCYCDVCEGTWHEQPWLATEECVLKSVLMPRPKSCHDRGLATTGGLMLALAITPPRAHAAWSPALRSWMPPPLPAERKACGPPPRGPVPVSCSRLASALELAPPWAQFALALERSPPWAHLAWALEATPPWAQGVLVLEMTPPRAHASLVFRVRVLVRVSVRVHRHRMRRLALQRRSGPLRCTRTRRI